MKYGTTGLVMGALALGLVAVTGPASADSRIAAGHAAADVAGSLIQKVSRRGHHRGFRSHGYRSHYGYRSYGYRPYRSRSYRGYRSYRPYYRGHYGSFRGHHRGFRFTGP